MSRSLENLLLGIFSLISVFMLFLHEPWADEAQAWLLAENSSSLIELLSYAGYEGSPMLWHIILYLFAKIGMPIFSMRVFHTLCAILSAYLILYRSPFVSYQKGMAIFGYYFLFEYNVVARSYVLSVLLLSYICSIYPKRFKHPLKYGVALGFLAQTNIHALIFSFVLVGVNFLENYIEYRLELTKWKNTVPIYAIFGISLLAAVILLLPPADLPELLADWHSIRANDPWGYSMFFLMRGFFPMQTPGEDFWSYDLRIAMFNYQEAMFIGILLVLIVIFMVYDKGYPLLIILPVYIGYSILFVYKRGICPRHCGFLYLVFFFVYWISLSYPTLDFFNDIGSLEFTSQSIRLPRLSLDDINKIRSVIFALILLIQVLSSPVPIYHDSQSTFSNAEPVADYLIAQNYTSDDSVLAGYPWFPTMSIIPHLPDGSQKMYFVQQDRFGTYVTWNERFFSSQFLTVGELINRSISFVNETNPNNYLLILDFEVEDDIFFSYFGIVRYFEDALVNDENYYIYQLLDLDDIELK